MLKSSSQNDSRTILMILTIDSIWKQIYSLNRSWKKLLKSLKTFTAKPFVIFVYTIQEWIQWNLWKTPFKKLESYNLSKWPCHFKFLKGYLPQNLLGPFLDTLSHFSLTLKRKNLNSCLKNSQIDYYWFPITLHNQNLFILPYFSKLGKVLQFHTAPS